MYTVYFAKNETILRKNQLETKQTGVSHASRISYANLLYRLKLKKKTNNYITIVAMVTLTLK